MLSEGGVTVSLHHLNMEELIRQVGVPRSSAFAAFGGKEELLTSLMVQLLSESDGSEGIFEATLDVVERTIAEHGHRMLRPDGSRDRDGSYAVLRETVRLTLRQNVEDTAGSARWQTCQALAATLPSLPPGRRERVAEALRESDRAFRETMTEFYAAACERLGRQTRPGVHWQHLATAGGAIVEGIVTHRRMGAPSASEVLIAPGMDGEPVEWTLAALAYLAMIEGLTEPVD